VCPLRVGAGVKGKVMSALSYGLPIVSTSIGIEGAGLIPGAHCLVADSAAQFAASILYMYNDEVLWSRLSLAGQELLRTGFSTARGAQVLTQAIERAHRHRVGLDRAEG
jgi:glycosyltransferase involved in cell wall biosynthesis